MKKFLLALIIMVPMMVAGCSKTLQKSEEEISAEQLAMIDSLLSSNAPVTTNIFEIGELEDIQLSAREIIYKGDTLPFLAIYTKVRNWGGFNDYNEGIAIVTPYEIKAICNNIDSVISKVSTVVTNRQNITFSSKSGLTIDANNSWGNDMPWDINVTANYQGSASTTLTKEQLGLFKNLLMNSYVETDGYKHLNKLSHKTPQIRLFNKFY